MINGRDRVIKWLSMPPKDLREVLNGMAESDIQETLRLALLEQDRDTRHKCAEAVVSCEDGFAHNVCMNAYATSDVPHLRN